MDLYGLEPARAKIAQCAIETRLVRDLEASNVILRTMVVVVLSIGEPLVSILGGEEGCSSPD
jgi:hypothetical protein